MSELSSLRVLIVGGGIGGLTAAIALRRVGLAPRIVEQAPSLGTVGAGITIQCNGSAVFDALGIAFAPEDVVSIGLFQMITDGGRVVMQGDSAEIGLPYASLNVHRADLQTTLVRHLERLGGRLELGCELVAVEPQGAEVVARFADGSTETVDLLIGADGIHSAVRRSLLGSCETRYSGQTCWRFAEAVSSEIPITTMERWSPGRRAGLVPLSRGRVYGYLVLSAPPGTAGPATTSVAHVQGIFGGMHPGLDEVFAQLRAREDAGETVPIHHGDLCDQPALSFGQGRVVLLGDAGHATTPNMGQGAGMAIEDAAAIALALGSGAVDAAGLVDHLEQSRRARVAQIQKTSWQIGSMAHWKNPVVRWIRDLGLSLMPTRMTVDQARATYLPGIALADELRAVVQERTG